MGIVAMMRVRLKADGRIVEILPDGSEMKLRIRKQDAEHVQKLRQMEDVFVIETPKEIPAVFKKYFSSG